MVPLSPTGIRNEFWRLRLLVGVLPPRRYARLFVTPGVEQHPRGIEALAMLLTGPAQLGRDINPWGDCDIRKVSLGGETFFLKVDCYAATETLDRASEDPADDEKTTRAFICLLASEY